VAENKWSILEAVNESNNLRAGGDEFGYYYKDGMMHIGDPLVFNQPDYSQLNEAIVKQGEEDTKNLTELMGKAQYIDKPPAWSRQSVRSNIFTFLNNFGIDPENSEFVSHLLAGDPSTELGALDLAGLMAIPEMVEGSRQFRAGLKESDADTMGWGAFRTGFGFAESAPYIGMAFKTLKQPVKDTIKLLGNKAREYKANQTPGTKLLSTDPTDPTVDAIIKLDDMVNTKNSDLRKLELPTDNKPGIIAFHGSGADFDEFKVEKIGTGEGNQAFGYGLYFTESEDIAKFYRSSVGYGKNVTYKGQSVEDLDQDLIPVTNSVYKGTFEGNMANLVGQQDTKKDRLRVLNNMLENEKANINQLEQAIEYPMGDGKIIMYKGLPLDTAKANRILGDLNNRLQAFENIKRNIDEIKSKPKGKLYKVGIAPKESELLDYDAPIGEQNEFIKTRLKKLVEEINLDDAMNLGFDPFTIGEAQALQKAKENMLDPERSVVSFLNDWAVFRGEQSTAEKLLDKYGIKGIRYKANQGVGARNVPETGKNNYVIFDDNLIKVMAKYGIVGPVALTAVASQKEGDDVR